MAVSITRSYSARTITRSYSARSWSTSSLPGGGGGGAMMSRAPGSVYGGAVGVGHMSMFSRDPSNDVALLCGDEKSHMQHLNDRLASYLEKVRNLEAANRKLEQQIKEHYEKKAPIQGKDLTVFFSTISDLRAQILRRVLEQHSIILQVDSASLAAGDFKNKCEMELNMRMAVEADITRLRSARDSLTLTSSDLETQIEGLKVELIDIKRNHEQEMLSLQSEHGSVNVDVECAVAVDLAQVLSETRQKYDTIVQKNHRELEQWFQTQVVVTQSSISTYSTEVKRSQMELSDMKKSHQSLLIELQAMLSKKSYLEQSLEDVCGSYSSQLSQLQLSIHTLEAELRELTVSIKQQATDYTILLDIKMRLEQEIAEYRRLLDGEGHTKAVEIQVQVVVVEEHKPHIERRVVTIVENIVDGQVVSSTEDTKVTQIQ